MQTCPLLIILRQSVAISVTVFFNQTKLTNEHFIFYTLETNLFVCALLLRRNSQAKRIISVPSFNVVDYINGKVLYNFNLIIKLTCCVSPLGIKS